MSDIPTTGDLVQLMGEGKLDPAGFLDILEKRLEEEYESITQEDLWDLYRSGRISAPEYLSHPNTPETNEEELPDETVPLNEVYEQKLAGETYEGRVEFE